MEPPDEEDVKDLGLVVAYARGFLAHMCALLREGARKAERAVWGAGAGFQMTLFARFGRGAVLLNRRNVRQVEGPLMGKPAGSRGGVPPGCEEGASASSGAAESGRGRQ